MKGCIARRMVRRWSWRKLEESFDEGREPGVEKKEGALAWDQGPPKVAFRWPGLGVTGPWGHPS